jgi:tetratricopeptide (TPR) repeat protein
LKEATRLYPDSAEAWGRLAIAYHDMGTNSRRTDAIRILDLSAAAARRALALDSNNVDAAIVALISPGLWFSRYADYARRCRQALNRYPAHWLAQRSNAAFYFEVGRLQDSIEASSPLAQKPNPSPIMMAMRSQALWSAGRPDEAESLLDKGIARWPRHISIWLLRYRYLLYSGKANMARAMIDEPNSRPIGIPESDFQILQAELTAMQSGSPDDVATAFRLHDALVESNSFRADNAALFASATQRLDEVFAYLDQLYFSGKAALEFRRNFPVKAFHPHSGKMTFFLFAPPMAAARADSRFDSFTARLGLKDYWREARVTPDFLA